MLIQIDFESDDPIYMQLRCQIIEGIARGDLANGETLPSVRQLAEDIGINLHTVNKTYNILKSEGYLTIDRRKGAVVNEIPHKDKLSSQQALDLKEDLKLTLAQMHCKGISKDEVNNWINEIYNNFSKRR